MVAFITTALLGIIICVFGAINMSGDISSLHSYHRNRVSEENVKPFGRLVGLGTIIVGVGVILMSVFTFIADISGIDAMVYVGGVLMFVGMIVGMAITFYAMKKYNGGIF